LKEIKSHFPNMFIKNCINPLRLYVLYGTIISTQENEKLFFSMYSTIVNVVNKTSNMLKNKLA